MPLTVPPELRDFAAPHAARIARELPLRGAAPFASAGKNYLFQCFTNRCGSTYLAQLLASTRAMGDAGEFFNAETVLNHARAHALQSLGDFIAILPVVEGWVTSKLGLDQLVMLTDAGLLDQIARQTHFLLLERQDRLEQAISRVIAGQTQQWSSEQSARIADSELGYSRLAIAHNIATIEQENFAFYRFFRANNIAPIHLAYEAVVANPQAAIDEILNWLEIPTRKINPTLIRNARQSNTTNTAWRARYLAEASK